MVVYKVFLTKTAIKHIPLLKAAHLANKAQSLIEILKNNPFQNPPSYEKLFGDLQGAYSRRINRQHRLVYTVDETQKIVKVVSMWSHYEET